MACYWPIPAYQDGPNGAVRLWPPKGTATTNLPCGRCLGCRGNKAFEWGERSNHEASLHKHNVFITLTYDDQHLPRDHSLLPEDLQRFIKRLRRATTRRGGHRVATEAEKSIRYLACGEYGETYDRPHYHAVIYNCAFPDAKRVGTDLYESDCLSELWPNGGHRIGDATAAAATYVAQYSLAKQGQGDHDKDGVYRHPPFLRMSLKPAIGMQWLEQYYKDMKHGYLVTKDGRKMGVPRYYRQKIKSIDCQQHEHMEARQYAHRINNPTDRNDEDRLRAAEHIHQQQKQRNEQSKTLLPIR